jgi:hypothetical protein
MSDCFCWELGAWQGEQSIGSAISTVSAGRMDKAENMSVTGTLILVEAASSHGQLVDSVSCLRAVEGRRMVETCGSRRNVMSGAQ